MGHPLTACIAGMHVSFSSSESTNLCQHQLSAPGRLDNINHAAKNKQKKVKSLKRERVRVEHAHLLVKGEHVDGGFGLLALARGRQKLVAHVQEEAVARVEPRSAAAAVTHDEALHSTRRRARLHQERPADAQ